MSKINCPFCNTTQKKATRTWHYGVAKIKVSRYWCKCGEMFNYYEGKKNSWTIPKKGKKKT